MEHINKFHLGDFTEEMAKKVCNWSYDPPYDVYNWPNWEVLQKEGEDIIKQDKREAEFSALLNSSGEFFGFVQFDSMSGNKLRIKLGIKPQLTGKGIGKYFLRLVIAEARKRSPKGIIDLEVLTWNERAIKVYKKSSFEIVETYKRQTPTGEAEFHRMELVK